MVHHFHAADFAFAILSWRNCKKSISMNGRTSKMDQNTTFEKIGKIRKIRVIRDRREWIGCTRHSGESQVDGLPPASNVFHFQWCDFSMSFVLHFWRHFANALRNFAFEWKRHFLYAYRLDLQFHVIQNMLWISYFYVIWTSISHNWRSLFSPLTWQFVITKGRNKEACTASFADRRYTPYHFGGTASNSFLIWIMFPKRFRHSAFDELYIIG